MKVLLLSLNVGQQARGGYFGKEIEPGFLLFIVADHRNGKSIGNRESQTNTHTDRVTTTRRQDASDRGVHTLSL